MRFALQRCCTTPVFLRQYESSTDAVLTNLGVEFVDIKDSNCCGYPLRNINFKAYVLLSARNLSLAAEKNLNVLTFCNCCYGTLKHVNHLMRENISIRQDINSILEKDGLRYNDNVEVRHLLEVFYEDIGVERIKERVSRTLNGIKIATHYGCHILRPSGIVQFDNPFAPSKFDQLVQATGAESISWSAKLECCGSPMLGVDDRLSLDITEMKIANAKESGADYLCTACPYCQLQFDRVQRLVLSKRNSNHQLPSLLYTQLIGLCLGVDVKALGIEQNELDATGIMSLGD